MLIKNTNKIEVYFVISFTGSFTLADRILIQLLCEVEPDVITEHYNEIIAGKSKNADAYVAVMWALIQPVGTLEKRLEGFLIFYLFICEGYKMKHLAMKGSYYKNNVWCGTLFSIYFQYFQFIKLSFSY